MKESRFQKIKAKGKKLINLVGPGFITGAADDDPSGIGTYSIAGAKYGLLLTWIVPFQLPLMYCIQEMCSRIGLVTQKGLTSNMKQLFPKSILYIVISILVFANAVNIGADIAIMAASINMLLAYNIHFLAILITVIIILTELFIPYHLYSRILMSISALLLAYVITGFMVSPDWLTIIQYTFIPHIKFDRDFILILTGFIGTTISPYLFFWQTSQEVEERQDRKKNGEEDSPIPALLKKSRIDTFVGMLFSQIIAFFIVITCYSTLHLNGITEINTAHDAALALKPFAGEWAYLLFTVGIIGAGFLGIPVLAGSAAYALSELLNWKEGLAEKPKDAVGFYSIIAISTLLGLGINFIGISPIKALLYAAIINCIASVPVTAFVVLLANKKEIMGKHKSGWLANTFGWLTFATVFASSALTLIYLW